MKRKYIEPIFVKARIIFAEDALKASAEDSMGSLEGEGGFGDDDFFGDGNGNAGVDDDFFG